MAQLQHTDEADPHVPEADDELQRGTSPEVQQAPTSQSFAGMIHRLSTKSLYMTGRSQWRFPTTPGEMPRYVQRSFRAKTFGLLALQQALVLSIMVAVDQIGGQRLLVHATSSGMQIQVVFYLLGMLNLFFIMSLSTVKDKYPCNYILLAMTTLVSGVFWGLTRLVVFTVLHFQIAGILLCSMLVATLASTILTSLERKLDGVIVVIASVYSGWIIGAIITVSAMMSVYGVSSIIAFGGAGFSFLLLSILILDAGRYLVRCRPDDFMSVIVSMDSTLMVVVSIPFFILSFCFLHGSDNVDNGQADEENQLPPVPVTFGRNGEA